MISPFLENDFMLRALCGGLFFALAAPLIGVFLSLKKLSLAGDAMSHALLPGIGISFLVFGASVPALFLGGLGAGAVTALALTFLFDTRGAASDRRATGLLSFLTGLGVLLLALSTRQTDLHQLLFGSILTVGAMELWILGAALVVTACAVFFLGGHFVYETVDPESFHRLVPAAKRVRFALFFLTALVLAAGVSTLGSLLVVGLLALPAAAVLEHERRWKRVIAYSMLLSTLAMCAGLIGAYHLDLPPGPVVITVAGIFFLGSLVMARGKVA